MTQTHRAPTVSFVGAGKVATTLAVLLARRGYTIASIVSRSGSSARSLARRVRCPRYSASVADLPPESQFVLVAVPDDALRAVGAAIARLPDLPFSRLTIAHTSGVVTSDVFRPLKDKGSAVFSLHPIQLFSPAVSLDRQMRIMDGITYGYEGPARTRRFARRIVRDLHGRFLEIPKQEKILYHVACVLASNYVVGLLGASEQLMRSVNAEGMRALKPLVEASVQNAFDGGAARALTGPIARGDVRTIDLHLGELKRRKKDVAALYRSVGQYALLMLRRHGRASGMRFDRLRRKLK